MTDPLQIRFCGFGGQGVLLMGAMLGHAAAKGGWWCAGANSYGAQARGGSCRSDLMVGESLVDYPHITTPDVLVAMSQDSYETFLPTVSPDGIVICDSVSVPPSAEDKRLHVRLDATAVAVSELGNRQVANMVLLAATMTLINVVDAATLKDAVAANVSPRFLESNMAALEAGFEMGGEAARGIAEELSAWAARKGLGRSKKMEP